MAVPPVPIYFVTAYGPTFGWVHPPAAPALDLGVVLCPPIGSELMCSYYPLRELARTLARAGIAVLRTDYHGTGDAAGYDDDPDRLAAWLATIDRAIDELRARGVARIGLVGLRLGATLAAVAASRRDDIACLALWAPCKTGKAFTRELKMLAQTEAHPGRASAIDDGSIEAGGFLLTAATVGELATLDLGKLGRPAAPRVLMIGRDDIAADHKLAAALGATVVDWPGYAKMMPAPHYAEPAPETFDQLAGWLREGAAPAERAFAADPIAEPVVALPDGVQERAIRFGPEGRMFGVLAEPAAGPRLPMAVVLASTGANYHVGPNRMYVRMARQWAARGYSVLRFDLSGIGDSEARPGAPPNLVYSANGVPDLELGVAEARARTSARTVAVLGMCSGGHFAFQAGLRGSALNAQILVNPQFYWRDGDTFTGAEAAVVEQTQAYRARARSWSSWKKLLTGRAQYRVLARTFARRAYGLGETWLQQLGSRLGVIKLTEDLASDLRAIAERDIATLIVFSTNDASMIYLQQRADGEAARLARTGRFKIESIDDTDHTLTDQVAQRRLIAVATDYLASVS